MTEVAKIGRYSLPIFVMHMYFIETDWIAISGLTDRLTALLHPGLLEGLRYFGRLATAVFLPVGISVVVGSIVPFARPLGFIAPQAIVAWRRAVARSLWSRFRRLPDGQT